MRLIITMTNGVKAPVNCKNTLAAYEYARNNVSKSVSRIELETDGGMTRALWDASWTPLSQYEGLRTPD